MCETKEKLKSVEALNEQLAIADQMARQLAGSLDDLKPGLRVLDDLHDRLDVISSRVIHWRFRSW